MRLRRLWQIEAPRRSILPAELRGDPWRQVDKPAKLQPINPNHRNRSHLSSSYLSLSHSSLNYPSSNCPSLNYLSSNCPSLNCLSLSHLNSSHLSLNYRSYQDRRQRERDSTLASLTRARWSRNRRAKACKPRRLSSLRQSGEPIQISAYANSPVRAYRVEVSKQSTLFE